MHLGPFGVLWITGAVSRVGCPVVGGCRALAVAGSSSGESASRLPALLPLHPAGFPTSGGGISTGRRMDGEVPPRGQGSADADNRARSFLIKSCWQSDTVLAES